MGLDIILNKAALKLKNMEFQAAIIELEAALHIHPNSYQLLNLLGVALRSNGRFSQSIDALEKAEKIEPNNINTLVNIAITYASWKKIENALFYFNKAVSIEPNNLDLLRMVANNLRKIGKTYEALDILERIITIIPKPDVKDVTTLADAYYHWVGNGEKAKRNYELAYSISPNNTDMLQKFSTFLQESRYGHEQENLDKGHQLAIKLFNILGPQPDIAGTVQSSSLNLLDYDYYDKFQCASDGKHSWLSLMLMGRVKTLQDRINLVDAHRMYGDRMEEVASTSPVKRRVAQRFNNKIRVGFLSSDLRNSPVGYFVWPIAENFDRSKFELYCYSFFPYFVDDIQRAFMRKIDVFRSYRAESDAVAAQSIADDNLDILFELGGLSSFSKVGLCAYKPAPVQVSWLGYPHSIGLKTIDYIVADRYVAPQNPDLLIEKPMLMPETWVSLDKIGFLPTKIAESIPEDRNGYITFGTMNASYKINAESFRVWAGIMNIVDNSRFLYCRPETVSQHLQANFRKHMAEYGITGERIIFASTRLNHLDYYNSIDIALDTFPHNGGTTTCETLWMGVPVVTLVGDSFFERISYSNLNNCGLSDLCAFNLQEYHDITLKLVANKERRRYLRQHLRAQILQHPLGQPKRFVRGFEDSILEVLGKQ